MPKILSFLLLLLIPAQGVSVQEPPEDSFARAVKLHQSGDLEGAIEAYKEFLDTHPGSLEAISNLGAVYARLGDYGRAIEEYRRALSLDEYNPAVRFNLGVAHYKAANTSEAAEHLGKVVAAQPGNRSAMLLLADCQLRMGREKEVIDLLSPMESKYKDDRTLLYLLGTAFIRDNQIEKGQLLIDRIFREGDSAEVRLMLGTARMMARDNKGALDEFAKAVQLNPKLPSARSYYGRALLATGDRTRAMENFRGELELNPNDFDSNLYMGVLLKQEQKFDEALAYLQRALRIRPDAPNVLYQIGSLYVSTSDLDKALPILERLAKEKPKFVEAHVSLATVYYRLKRKEDGDRHREIVQRLNAEIQERAPQPGLDPGPGYRGGGGEMVREAEAPSGKGVTESFEALAARASSAREANRTGEAIDLHRQALMVDPSWHEGWWYLGTLLYEGDRYAEARTAFARLAELKPDGGVAWAMLGLCDFQLRDYESSAEHLQKAQFLGVPAKTQLSQVSRYHYALLLNRYGKPEAGLYILYSLARQQEATPSILTAMGLCALALPVLPGDLAPDKADLVHSAGQAQYYMATRRMEEARRASQELIEKHPQTPHVHYSYGVFLLAENPDAALEEFRRELEISPSHVSARLQIAFEYIKRGEYGKGRSLAEEAVELAPDSFAARNALGRIFLESGEIKPAIRELETGLKLAPDSPEMHYALARAYARDGRKEDAARAREEFTRLDRIRRTRQEGPQAVGGIVPPAEEQARP